MPLFAQTSLEKGVREFKLENYDEALVEFKEARRQDPASTSAAYFLGITYKALGEYKEATDNLREAVTRTPPIKEALPELIDALYVTDNIDEAKKWIAVGQRENIYPDRIQFMNGLILMRENRTEDAIAAFEKAKAANPATANAADFQIALANAKLGKFKESQRIFKTIITLDPTSDLANYAKDYERTITEKLDAERPFRFNIGLGFKYDSNVNAQPASGTIFDNQNLSSAVTGKEDTAINLTLGATYIAPFSFRTPYSLSVQYSLYADRYFRRDDYNIAQQSLSITPGYSWGKWSFMLPFAGRYVNLQREIGTDMINSANWWSNTRYMISAGTSPTVRYMVNDRNILEIAYGWMKNKYYTTTENTAPRDPNEDRDGISNSGALGWTYFFKNATALLAFRYTYTDMDTDGNNWAYNENKFNFSFVYPLLEKLKFQFSSEASFVVYKNVNTIFDIRRRDEVYNNSVNFIYSLTKNLDVFNQYSYTQDHCNISTYNFNRFIAMLGVEYRF
ncbi:MAG: tetratricopeptide repeat protein [Syntrophorhabdus sp.]